jgi:hypothetical protein
MTRPCAILFRAAAILLTTLSACQTTSPPSQTPPLPLRAANVPIVPQDLSGTVCILAAWPAKLPGTFGDKDVDVGVVACAPPLAESQQARPNSVTIHYFTEAGINRAGASVQTPIAAPQAAHYTRIEGNFEGQVLARVTKNKTTDALYAINTYCLDAATAGPTPPAGYALSVGKALFDYKVNNVSRIGTLSGTFKALD